MTTATATTKVTYRKTKTGEWVAYGPASALRVGAVTVSKRSGETKVETVARLGKPFPVDGTAMVYGYLEAPRRTQRGRYESRSCEECQWVEDAGDCNGCSRHRGNPRN
jgi:hypothetical protein